VTKRNAEGAPIPWLMSPGVTSPNATDLTIVADSGQITYIGEAGETVVIAGTVLSDSLTEHLLWIDHIRDAELWLHMAGSP